MCTGVKRGPEQIIPECVSGTGIGWLGDPGRKGDCFENENVPLNPGAQLRCSPSSEKLVTLIFLIRFADHLKRNSALVKVRGPTSFLDAQISDQNSSSSQIHAIRRS